MKRVIIVEKSLNSEIFQAKVLVNIDIKEFIPNEVPLDLAIFNSPSFYEYNRSQFSKYLTISCNDKFAGVFSFRSEDGKEFHSPVKGTFGGLEFIDNIKLEDMNNIIKSLKRYLVKYGARRISVIEKPFSYNFTLSTKLFNSYLSNGFRVGNQEINYTIEVDGNPLFNKMAYSHKKKWKRCRQNDFVVNQVFSEREIIKCYEIIAENRADKNRELSMSLVQILEMYKKFPSDIIFFLMSFEGKPVASSICIRLSKNVLYVFYWGDKLETRPYSPIVFLASYIYKFAHDLGISLLDIGTSTQLGIPMYSLCQFKERLGCQMSPRITYEYSYV